MFRSAAALAFCAGLLAAAPPQIPTSPAVPPPRLPAPSETLHAAVRAGKLDEVKRLLASGANVNARDAVGNTPLLYAAWAGNELVTAFLLDHGADVNSAQSGPPVLTWAVLAGRTEVVKLLLSAGARVDVRDIDGRTLLHVAARYGYDGIAELLLAAHADVSSVDGAGRTALDEALLFAQTSVVPVLLRHGADPRRVRSADGRGPLHEACIKGSAALVEMLVNAGADPASPDNSGQTPLDLALAYKNRGAIAALEHLALERADCQATADSAMQSATLRGHTELARLLLAGGFNITRRAPGGTTFLHLAALKAQKKIVALFLEHGAEVNALDGTGGTPLHSAALSGNTEVISLLLNAHARLDLADQESGATPLMLAASVSRTEAVAFLLEHGANPALRDHAGHTALDRARETDDAQAVKMLEAAGRRATAAPKATV